MIEHVIDEVKSNFDLKDDDVIINHDFINVSTTISNLKDILLFLRDNEKCLFVMLISISGVDYFNAEKRFEVNYNLLSLKNNLRVMVKVRLDERESIPSIESIFSSATWYQREVYDMYGVNFTNSKDSRRILTDYNFKHFPLRKDFPLTGFEEVRYDYSSKQVIYEPVKLDQEYRNFDFSSSWGDPYYNIKLPGDEKADDIEN